MSVIAIVSYEMIARTASKLSVVSIELLVCDEAHRLKNLNGRLREQVYLTADWFLKFKRYKHFFFSVT